jgi:hypothetical protein
MKHALLLPLSLIAAAAVPAPATRPAAAKPAAAEQVIVQVRHVEYRLDPKEPAIALGGQGVKIPADATEISSIQVAAAVGGRFETVAVVSGTTYRLAGQLARSKGMDYFRLEIDYCETSGGAMKNVTQVTSNIMARVEEPFPLTGMLADAAHGKGLIVTLKHPAVAAPAAAAAAAH